MHTNFKINQLTDDTIIILKNNPKLFDKFLDSNKGFLENIILKYINHSHSEYEDVLQVAKFSLWKALKKFEKKYDNTFSTFAYIVIKNDILQYLNDYLEYTNHTLFSEDINNNNIKNNKNNNIAYIDFALNNIKQKQLYKDFENTILDKISFEQSLNKLTKLEKDIFTLKSEGYTLQEIADKYNKKIGVIKNIYYNAMYKLHYYYNIQSMQD